ncbi:MAG: hypothetical protein AB9M60_12035 [Leptothrix sp. (in: b-proteobacteria)]
MLVALAVLATGLGAVLQLQSALRVGTDAARQRAEALRIAQAHHESLRGSVDLAGWQAIGGSSATATAPTLANASFERVTSVSSLADPPLKHLHSAVTWTDREGQPQQLTLDTLLAGVDPALGGALVLNRAAPVGSAARGRQPLIPVSAQRLGDGRSAYKPRAADALTWVFDDATGALLAVCTTTAGLASSQLDAASLRDCRAQGGLLIHGQVRFATDADTLTAADAQNPLSAALPLDLRLTLTSTNHPSPGWQCSDDAPDSVGAAPAQLSVAYQCVVVNSALPLRWSGRLELVPIGWALAASGGANGTPGYKVCRYSADHNHNARIDNAEHPAAYAAVAEPLGDQNFLVIRAAASCPLDSGVASSPGVGVNGSNWLDDSTLAHQP